MKKVVVVVVILAVIAVIYYMSKRKTSESVSPGVGRALSPRVNIDRDRVTRPPTMVSITVVPAVTTGVVSSTPVAPPSLFSLQAERCPSGVFTEAQKRSAMAALGRHCAPQLLIPFVGAGKYKQCMDSGRAEIPPVCN